MYSIAIRASGGNEDYMAGYYPLVMGKAQLLWLDNLSAECIISWETLSCLLTTNYQATYNRPGNTHHLARVRMRRDETLREYTNRYFENRNTLTSVKDDDIIAYYKKGITNIKLFEKIHDITWTTYDLTGSRIRRYTSCRRPHLVQNPAHKINVLQGLSYSDRSPRPTLPKQGMSRDFS
jgi:hypothetical protein